MKALLIDAYDSFVYIIEQYLAELGAEPTVVRSAAENADLVRELKPDVLVLGPGPSGSRRARRRARRGTAR